MFLYTVFAALLAIMVGVAFLVLVYHGFLRQLTEKLTAKPNKELEHMQQTIDKRVEEIQKEHRNRTIDEWMNILKSMAV